MRSSTQSVKTLEYLNLRFLDHKFVTQNLGHKLAWGLKEVGLHKAGKV